MSALREGKKKPKAAMEPIVISWEERKTLADKDEELLEKQIQDLKAWTNMIDSMKEEELKEYLKNRADELKTVKIQKINSKQNQRAEKPKCSTSNGIMASVWKFHEEEEEEEEEEMFEF